MDHTSPKTCRRGVTSLLAMVYLALIGALAVGFYTATSTSAIIVSNEKKTTEALVAAECGVEFMRHSLREVTLPPILTNEQRFAETRADLANLLNGTPNLGNDVVGQITYPTGLPPRFEIPSDPNNYIALGVNGPYFRVRVEQANNDVLVTTIGKSGSALSSGDVRAGIEVRFRTEEWPTDFFKYGIASQGPVVYDVSGRIIQGTPASHASILSTHSGANPLVIGNVASTPLSPTGITGNVTLLTGKSPTYQGVPGAVSIGGQTSPAGLASQVVNKPADEMPEFPKADTSMFREFATTNYTSGQALYENVIIPPGTNPTFNAGMTIRGVLYVQQPNVVRFNGNVTIAGIIVTEDRGVGDITTPTNQLIFSGNGGAKSSLESLTDPRFAALKELAGGFIIAPGFDVTLTGNFGNLSGHIAGDRVTLTGSTTSTVTGSIMTLKPNTLAITGATRLSLASPAQVKWKGLRFKERYVPDRESYREVRPPKN